MPPPYSADWAEAAGYETLLAAADRHLVSVAFEEMQAGDIVLFRFRAHLPAKHAGVVVSGDAMVHAVEGGPAAEVALVPWWRRRIAGVFRFPDIAH